jgi:glutathione S-transferase
MKTSEVDSMKLYGFSASNYYNAVKHLLLAKGLRFEEVKVYPNQSEEYLKIHPLGKVPALETPKGIIVETDVLMRYIDQQGGESFFPSDDFERAKCEEIMKMAEIYLELPARRLSGEVLLGLPRCESAFKEARPLMQKGLRALDVLCSCDPYLMGAKITAADILLRYVLVVAKMNAFKVYDWKLLADYPKLKAWETKMAMNEVSQKVDADAKASLPELMAYFNSKN